MNQTAIQVGAATITAIIFIYPTSDIRTEKFVKLCICLLSIFVYSVSSGVI